MDLHFQCPQTKAHGDMRHTWLQDMAEAHAALRAADHAAGFADSVPAWTPLLEALSAATSAGSAAQQAAAAAMQQRRSDSASSGNCGAELLRGADAAVEQVLLWGQTAAAAHAAWAAPLTDGMHVMAPLYIQPFCATIPLQPFSP
jgi:hypothetical protein